MLFFTQAGKCFWMRVYEIPEGSKTSKGRAIQNLINLPKSQNINQFFLPLATQTFVFYIPTYTNSVESHQPCLDRFLNVAAGVICNPRIPTHVVVTRLISWGVTVTMHITPAGT